MNEDRTKDAEETQPIKAAGFHRQPEHYGAEFSHVILPIETFPVGCDIVVNKITHPCGCALAQVAEERERQDGKWGGESHDDTLSIDEWHELLSDYIGWGRRMAKMGSPDKARRRLIQVAALAVAQVEAIDRQTGGQL